jgi:2Fe-2S ferredoxin
VATIHFTDHLGTEHVVDARIGESLMIAARDQGVPGIAGDCGGSCICATCAIFVAPEWFAIVGPPGEDEAMMLAGSLGEGPMSRLACQIRVTPELEGLRVTTPGNT